jgi:polyisoprenoid-binding protein YceI
MLNKTAIIILFIFLQLSAKAQQAYRLDIKKSKVLWNNQKTMGGHFGYLLFNSGTLNCSATGEPADGSFSMDMNSIRATDNKLAAKNEEVNARLKTEGFFASAKYPEAVVKVKQIVRVEKSNSFKVNGDLTIKGITNPVEFTAIIVKTGETISIKADTKIDRRLWHIDFKPNPQDWSILATFQDSLIDEKIAISLNLTLTK